MGMSEHRYRAAGELTSVNDGGPTDGAASMVLADMAGADAALTDLARSIVISRRKLSDRLDPALFANPGMDILLFLFAEGINGATVTTNACCAAAGVPRTTALRWIKLLQERGLVEGSDDASDRRVTMLGLTPAGRKALREWLADIVALPLAKPEALG
jgi:DNA-binding MarR family transcriptional regulator